MSEIDAQLAKYALKSSDILVPKSTIDLKKWAIVACDQYTSEPEYWSRVAEYVGSAPSTLHLIYPEVYLDEEHPEHRIASIGSTMQTYLEADLFDIYENAFFLIQRITDSAPQGRWGLLATLDLEAYDFSVDSKSLIRATEETIIDRIPPRMKIRHNAALEIPHILVLVDDPNKHLLEPLVEKRDTFPSVYQTELMENGGSVQAWLIDRPEEHQAIADAIGALHSDLDTTNPLLYAMGDGNHSLATAKCSWEEIKQDLTAEEFACHPCRYALVEIENIHDPALEFEPIHRVLFGLDENTFQQEIAKVCSSFEKHPTADLKETAVAINGGSTAQRFGYIDQYGIGYYTLNGPKASIAAASLQTVIDRLLEQGLCTVDYIHGSEVTARIGKSEGNIGLLMPEVSKNSFFKAVIADRSFPRKTFSMGAAHEKRFYVEARNIAQPSS